MLASELLKRQHAFFNAGCTKSIEYRKRALETLRMALHAHESKLLDALKADLNKSETEGYMTELGLVFGELAFAKKNLKKWSKATRKRTSLILMPGKCMEYSEPYGSVLIIAPWNYPLLLCLTPLIGALAAGNCAVVKPSELAPATSKAVADMIEEYFSPEYIAVVQGDKDCSTMLLNEPFDFVFYTGSEAVGKIVMKAAAQHLTPVCLELGGKSPCIVDETAKLKIAAKRIASGKVINAGQTCVAPDYLFVHESVADELIEYIIQYIKEFVGESPLTYSDYPSIINDRHTKRLLNLLQSGKVIYGGRSEGRRIEPTLVREVPMDSAIMQEEIFGPILPIFTYGNLDEVITYINARPKPLALYLFTEDNAVEKRILRDISFGGGCINDTLMHVASHHMNFGGVGNSGMGGYHGKYSFDLFSHKKSILKQPTWIDLPMRYHPYKDSTLSMLRKILK